MKEAERSGLIFLSGSVKLAEFGDDDMEGIEASQYIM